jgi:hypothetical protein
MPRKSKNSVQVMTRIEIEKKKQLESLLLKLGYSYIKDGKAYPAWGKWLEDIAGGELQIFKKIT